MNEHDRNTHRITAAAMVALAACAAAVLYLGDPTHPGLFPPCPLHFLTGIYCPGCGSTRALHELLHGHLRAAAGFNFAMLLALPFVLYSGASYVFFAFRGRRLPTFHLTGRAIYALGALLVAFAILRNIPHAPFTLLAP
jgi:hypothetical protein